MIAETFIALIFAFATGATEGIGFCVGIALVILGGVHLVRTHT